MDSGPVRLMMIAHAFNYRVAVLRDGVKSAIRVGRSPGAYGRLLLAVYVRLQTGLLVFSDWLRPVTRGRLEGGLSGLSARIGWGQLTRQRAILRAGPQCNGHLTAGSRPQYTFIAGLTGVLFDRWIVIYSVLFGVDYGGVVVLCVGGAWERVTSKRRYSVRGSDSSPLSGRYRRIGIIHPGGIHPGGIGSYVLGFTRCGGLGFVAVTRRLWTASF